MSAAQSSLGSLPAWTAAQVRFFWPVRASVQAVQAPVQAVSQQTLSGEQLPERHWAAVSQASPAIFFTLQVPFEQKLPSGQSPSPLQGLAQPVMAQGLLPQAMTMPTAQVPLLSQVPTGVNLLSLEQEAGEQTCSCPGLRQALWPSQVPSWPHWDVAPPSLPPPRGSMPADTGPHFPFSGLVKAIEQALH